MLKKQFPSASLESAAVTNVSTQNLGAHASAGNALAAFAQAYAALGRRKQELEAELAQIQNALARVGPATPAPIIAPAPEVVPPPARTRGLTKAVTALLTGQKLTKAEIVEKLQAQGFVLGHNPVLKVDPILYNKAKFCRDGKLFTRVSNAG